MNHLKPGNIAFWRYHSGSVKTPFLAAQIVRICDSPTYRGSIEAEGYGPGWFKPVFCLPLKEGRALKAKLAELDNQWDAERNVIDRLFKARVRDALPEGIDLP